MNMSVGTTNTKAKSFALVLTALLIIVSMVLAVLANPMSKAAAQTAPVWRVDANGNITRDGVIFRVKGASWFGLEGRHEPSNDTTNPSGAPMEQYIGNVFWAPSNRTYAQDAAEFKAMGLNLIRLPLVPQTLSSTNPQGMAPYLKNNPSVVIPNSRAALEATIRALNVEGIAVLLDIHACSNYVGWRAGRFDARPPWADFDRDNYDFKRENYSCASSGNPSTVTTSHPYSETQWRSDLRTLAGMNAALGVTNVMGIDIFNEPHDYTWAQWRTLIDASYAEINSVNSNILVFAQGIGTTPGKQDGSPTTFTQEPHGVIATNPNWGENLYSAGTNPPTMPKNRLVYSPHTYGPSVFVQKMFMDPAQSACTGLEGDAAGDANCNIVINATLLNQGWQEHFGYLKAQGYAIVIGEWGGNWDWPGGAASQRDIDRWNHLTTNTTDAQWQTAFKNYLASACILDTIYWSVNPESGDTGGLYTTPYTEQNKTAWGTWGSVDSRKMSLLNSLWNTTGCGTAGPTPTAVNTSTGPTSTPTNTSVVVGPTATRTRTATSGPSPTRTRTATAGPSATRTATPLAGATATRTNTPAVAPSNTPVVAPTNTTPPTGGACSPVTSTVTAPFTFDGAGTFCWQIATIPSYVNSWNTNSVSINGTAYSNVWVGSGSLPAKINGNYYVSYNGSFAWSHLEIR